MDPIFNIKIWNVFDRVAEEQARTNNAIEGFNSAIQKTLSCQHPTIWKLISSLKKEAVMAKKKLIEEEQGYCSNKRKRRVRIENNIKKLLTTYDASEKVTFLEGIASNLHQFKCLLYHHCHFQVCLERLHKICRLTIQSTII